jgi:hypothetical protein
MIVMVLPFLERLLWSHQFHFGSAVAMRATCLGKFAANGAFAFKHFFLNLLGVFGKELRNIPDTAVSITYFIFLF